MKKLLHRVFWIGLAVSLMVVLQGAQCPGGGPPPGVNNPPPTGPFTFTATPGLVTMPTNTMSQDVTFTITPVGNFTGTVRVTWETIGTCSPSPNTNDVDVVVNAGTPATFTRKMYRWDSQAPMSITWRASHAPTATERTLAIQLRAP